MRDAASAFNSPVSSSWREAFVDWSWIFAAMPAIFAGVLLTHAFHLRLALGRWPVRYRDYPSARLARILLDIHELGLIVPGFWLTVFAVPLWLLSAVVASGRFRKRTVGRQAVVFVDGVCALFGVVSLLSGTFYPNWLLD